MDRECRTELIDKISELIEKGKKAEDEMSFFSQKLQRIDAIHHKYEQLYGGKYGINRREMERHLETVELDRMIRLVQAEDSQPQKTGVLGFGGMKKEEYYIFTDKLNLIRCNLKAIVNDWAEYLQKQQEIIKQFLDQYDEETTDILKCYQAAIEAKEATFCSEEGQRIVCLGNVCQELPDHESIRKFLTSSYNCIKENQIELLVGVHMDHPKPCYIKYQNTNQKKSLNEFVRNLLKQIMYQLPVYQYEIYYLDGMNNGSGLQEMLDLQNVQDDYAESIAPQLITEGFRMLHVGRDSDGIHRELVNLEKYLGQVTDLLQGKTDFADYNNENEQKIPYKFVVLDDVDVSGEKGLIKKLIVNGLRCGVFVLFMESCPEAQQNAGNEDIRACIKEQGTLIEYNQGMSMISFAENPCKYAVSLFDEKRDYHEYVSHLSERTKAVQKSDNSFSTCFPENYPYGKYTSTVELDNGNLEGKIEIPFAVDRRGRLVSIELGSSNYAHGLISGATGSGKSTMLHMLINSVVMNYHPEDVEIWLADYKKVEFSVYIEDKPPHVKFIGIERNEEFTFSLIDLISGEYERRLELFHQENVRNIDLYKKKFGMHSMARILLIIDEFHLLSQQVHENEVYSRKLENLLAEGRAAGIVCLFADQAISKGLNGLTSKGKDQMRMRLAMVNSKEEMQITLDMNHLTDANVVLDKGEVLTRRTRTVRQLDGSEVKENYLEQVKVVFLSDECRREIAHKALTLYGEGRKALIVDGNKPAIYNEQIAKEYEQSVEDGRRTAYLHLGKPSNLDKCFAIPLTRNYGDNVLCILDKFDLQQRVFLSAMNSFLQEEDRKVYVLADDNDDFYCKMRRCLREKSQEFPTLKVYSDYGEICGTIKKISEELIDRRSHQKEEEILIFWFGLESMLKEFSYYPQLKETSNRKNALDDIESLLDAKLAAFTGEVEPDKQSDEQELFDATAKIVEICTEGGKRGIHQFVFYSSVLSLKMAKEIKPDNFKFKLSGFMSKDNAFDFYGTAKFMESMDEKDGDMLVCHNGIKGRFFLPYLVEN